MGGSRRPVFIWTRQTEAADLLGMVSTAVQLAWPWSTTGICETQARQHVADQLPLRPLATFLQASAALASASVLAKPVFPQKADLYLRTSRALYRWAAEKPGALEGRPW